LPAAVQDENWKKWTYYMHKRLRLSSPRWREMLCILGGLVACTLLIWQTNLDQRIARFFYIPGEPYLPVWQKWQGMTDSFWLGVYTLTPWPSLLLGVIALLVLGLGFRLERLRLLRRSALFMLLLLALGPGLLVNVVLKNNLDKPRPSEVREFGGDFTYAQFWQPGKPGNHSNGSFPSGHAAMAFSVIGPWFILRQRHARLGMIFLACGSGWGLLVGAARIAQGGHFFSDVLWSGGLIYLLGLALASMLKLDHWPAGR
jgi:lipid A 4'-phosphatase